MTTVSVKISGLDKLKRKFRAMPAKVQRAALKANEANAKAFYTAAKNEAPHLSGELRLDFAVYPARGERGLVWRVKAGTKGGEAFYARFVEFGTSEQQAQPFFFTTYRMMKPRFSARVSREVNRAIRSL